MILKKLKELFGRPAAKEQELPLTDIRLSAVTRDISGDEHQVMLAERRRSAKEWRSLGKEKQNEIYKAERIKQTEAHEKQLRELGITHYILRVSVPQRADPRCLKNNGKTFAFASPPASGNPGAGLCLPVDGICRCHASPVIPGFTAQ